MTAGMGARGTLRHAHLTSAYKSGSRADVARMGHEPADRVTPGPTRPRRCCPVGPQEGDADGDSMSMLPDGDSMSMLPDGDSAPVLAAGLAAPALAAGSAPVTLPVRRPVVPTAGTPA